MLNRRLIRIKVFKVLYSMVSSGNISVAEAVKYLDQSCEKTLHLYYFILNASVALKRAAEAKIEIGLKKFNPTEEEKNPNRKFVNNQVTAYLENCGWFLKFCEGHGLVWNEDLAGYIKKLFNSIIEKDYYKEYMASGESSLKEDCELFIRIYLEEFEDNEDLEYYLEEMSLYWMDDLDYVLNTIVRNLEMMISHGDIPVPSVFVKDEDWGYAKGLLSDSLVGYDGYEAIIMNSVSNWDRERIVSTDLALMVQAITEAVTCKSIPVKVTINEYVEISKYYSTANSKTFINGILDRIFKKMMESGEIVKTGRGLIED